MSESHDGAKDGSRVSHYDYELPEDRIAAYPVERRDESRLMVVPQAHHLDDGDPAEPEAIRHLRFRDLPELLREGDLIVVNESRVLPARLLGQRAGGGEGEILLLSPEADPRRWIALAKPGRRLGVGKRLRVAEGLAVEVEEVFEDGTRRVRLETEDDPMVALERHGHIPLPPYLGREDEELDRERYQTVYARDAGSVAAPTAGLHFTPELLDRIEAMGVGRVAITLHVGAGTFRPVDVEDPTDHEMHAEVYHVSPEAAERIEAVRAAGGRIWAIGTTVVRTLETVARDGGGVRAGSGSTQLFIHPPWRWRAVDGLVTNFHLPRSTLLMLVAARMGYRRTMQAYETAIAEGYRFYSYGDAMVIPPAEGG